MFAKYISTEAFKKLTFGDSLINIYEAGHLTLSSIFALSIHYFFIFSLLMLYLIELNQKTINNLF